MDIASRDRFIAEAVEFAKERMLSGEPLVPMFHAEGAHKDHHIILTPWRDTQEKYMFLEMIRAGFKMLRVKRYLHMSEAWVSPREFGTRDQGDVVKRARELGGVVNVPGRREGLIVTYTEPSYREARTFLTLREGAEDVSRAIGFEEHSKICGVENLAGDFFELLPDPNAPVDLKVERIVREFLSQFTVKR